MNLATMMRASRVRAEAARRAELEAWDRASRCPRCGLAFAHDHAGESYAPPAMPADLVEQLVDQVDDVAGDEDEEATPL